jgi:photosystem II stability/assembly factor-like uncharacterized protein
MNTTRFFCYSLLCLVMGLTSPLQHTGADDDPLKLVTIDMMDTANGWALYEIWGEDGPWLVRTQDGGQTWSNVTPPDKLSEPVNYYEMAYSFYDALHAWIFYPPEVWHTQDGGQTWQLMSEIEDYSILHQMDFVDENIGWLLERDCCAAGNEFARLFRTLDAGATWELINSDAFRADLPVGINHDLTSAYHPGMDFYDASTGWITLASIADYGGILRTGDGGYSWQSPALPVSEGATRHTSDSGEYAACNVFEPRAISVTSFFAVGICQAPNGDMSYSPYLHTTEDGGESWTIHRLPVHIGSPLDHFAFDMVSPDVVWISNAITSEAPANLYRSTDGGDSWVNISAIDLSGYPPYLDFVDEQRGWTINQAAELLTTNDGGETWQPVQARLT